MKNPRTFIAYYKDDESKKPICFLELKDRVVELCAAFPEEVDKTELVEINLDDEKTQIKLAGKEKWLVPTNYDNDHLFLMTEDGEDAVVLTSDDSASGRNAFSMGRPLNRCWIVSRIVVDELQKAGLLSLLQEQMRDYFVLYYCQVNMVELWKHTEEDVWEQFIEDVLNTYGWD